MKIIHVPYNYFPDPVGGAVTLQLPPLLGLPVVINDDLKTCPVEFRLPCDTCHRLKRLPRGAERGKARCEECLVLFGDPSAAQPMGILRP